MAWAERNRNGSYGGAVQEIPYIAGSYGSPVLIGGSAVNEPTSAAVGANGNVFWAQRGYLFEILHGAYDTSVAISTQYPADFDFATLDNSGRLYAISTGTIWMFTP